MNVSSLGLWMQPTCSSEEGFSIKWYDAAMLVMAAAGIAFLVYKSHERREASPNPMKILVLQEKYERRCLIRNEKMERGQWSEVVKRTKPWPKLPPLTPWCIRDFCEKEADTRENVEKQEDKSWEELQMKYSAGPKKRLVNWRKHV